jgi:hypothetical protein
VTSPVRKVAELARLCHLLHEVRAHDALGKP